MRRTKNHYISLGVLVFFFIFSIASNASKKTFNNASKWIPGEFDPNKQVLLIENFHTPSVQAKAEEYLNKKYPYKYEFVSKNEIMQGQKYRDTILYRFALISSRDFGEIHTFRNNGSMQTMSVSGVDFGFYDRKMKVTLPSADRASSNALMTFKPIINTLIKNAAKE